MTVRALLWTLIAIGTALRLAWAASLGGVGNEAYYYLFAKNLDWGFFDHPPMVGIVAAAGLKLAPGLPAALALRLGFIAMFAGSTWLMARLAGRLFGPAAGLLAAVGLNATVFYGLKIGTCADPDGPLLFFWLLTLDRLDAALEEPGPARPWTWAAVGLAWGGALLSKYYAVLIPVGLVAHLILRPSSRRVLRTPGPYLAAAIGLACFAPVIVWNAQHDWVSFLYQGTRAGGFHGFRAEFFFEAVLAQALYLTPWLWAALVLVALRIVARGPWRWSDRETFLLAQALPALGLFLGVATFRRIMPHWPMIGFVALFPLLGRELAERLAARPAPTLRRVAFVLAAPALLGCLFVTQAQTGLFQDGRGRLLGLLDSAEDPTLDAIRWRQIAGQLDRLGLLHDRHAFLFTDHWRLSAELAMATRLEAPVCCLNRDARSFTYWSRPEDYVGRDGIFVRVTQGVVAAEQFAPWFTQIVPIATFPIVRAGTAVETVRVYRCVRQVEPFQFGFRGDGPIPRPARPAQLAARTNDVRSL